jgi:hypothetical protein
MKTKKEEKEKCLNCRKPMVKVKDPITKTKTGYLWHCSHCMPKNVNLVVV